MVEMKEILSKTSRDTTVPSSSINDAGEVVVSGLLNVVSAAGNSARVDPALKDEGNKTRDTVRIQSRL